MQDQENQLPEMGQPEYRGSMPPAPPTPPRRAKLRDVWVVGLIALIVGGVVGSAVAKPEPTPAPPAEVRTVTQTVEVEVTPDSCLDALDSVEKILGYAAGGFTAASHGFAAAGRFDIQGILAANADMRASVQKVSGESPTWKRTRNACRASA